MEGTEVGTDDLEVLGAARAAWSALGTESELALEAVELWWIELPFRRPVTTASTTHTTRSLVLVSVIATAAGETVEGWGECAALGDPGYVEEDVSASFASLEGVLVPALVAETHRVSGRLPPPARLGTVRARAPHSPMAFGALEMAVADAHLRAEGRSFASLLSVAGRSVEAGAVVGTFPTSAELVAAVEELAGAGYRRLKVKIAPGWDVEPLAAITASFPTLRTQVDANGAYREADADALSALDRFELLCLEQPYPAAELEAHVRLAARLTTPLCLDESLRGPADVADALERRACSVVEVKPGRLGGVGAALDVIESCTAGHVPLWIGGMFESGFARGINTALAALPGFAWPGDLSPARTYLAADVVPEGSGPPGSALPLVTVPTDPGMGPPLERTRLERHRLRHVVVPASAASRR
jgi:o-succinylbenzoate synthase